MDVATADLCDLAEERGVSVAVVGPVLRSYGGVAAFGGPAATVAVHEDNVLVKQALSEPGAGRVLVVHGGASRRCALLGDKLAAMGVENGWAGVLVWGCIRDAAVVGTLPLGVMALSTHPRRSVKRGEGTRDELVSFAGLAVRPGDFVYADADGLIVSPEPLHEVDGR